MALLDVEAIRREIRALDFVRGTPAEVTMWRDDDADSRSTGSRKPPAGRGTRKA